MAHIFLNILLITGLFSQSNNWYKKFINTINHQEGVAISVVIHQKQFESTLIDTGFIEIKGKNKYILELQNETVFINDDIIKTWNKIDNQLIIDKKIKGEISIFDLLTGEFKDISLGKATLIGEYVKLDFRIQSMEYEGSILMYNSGRPKEININYGYGQSAMLTVDDFKIGKLTLYDDFNPKNVEIIDIRE